MNSYTLSGDTARRMMRMLKWWEQQPHGGPDGSIDLPGVRNKQLVQVTGGVRVIDNGFAFQEAQVVQWNANSASFTEVGECLLANSSDTPLQTDAFYIGSQTGNVTILPNSRAESELPAFLTSLGCCEENEPPPPMPCDTFFPIEPAFTLGVEVVEIDGNPAHALAGAVLGAISQTGWSLQAFGLVSTGLDCEHVSWTVRLWCAEFVDPGGCYTAGSIVGDAGLESTEFTGSGSCVIQTPAGCFGQVHEVTVISYTPSPFEYVFELSLENVQNIPGTACDCTDLSLPDPVTIQFRVHYI
jgi:hypothetical protein